VEGTPPFPLPWAAASAPTPPLLEAGGGNTTSSSSQPVALFAETLRELSSSSSSTTTKQGQPQAQALPPPFPAWVLPHTHRLLRTFSGLGEGAALARVYPFLYGTLGPSPSPHQQQPHQPPQSQPHPSRGSARGLVADLARRIGVDDMRVGPLLARVSPLLPPQAPAGGQQHRQHVLLEFEPTIDASGRTHPPLQVAAPGGDCAPSNDPLPGFVETPTTRAVLTAMCQEHALGRDVCLVGGKGVGKSRLLQLFARRLGYGDGGLEVFPLFREMTPRDLLQRRATDPSDGSTIWADSPLVAAAKRGRVCVLDGVHRLHPDTLASLARLLQDREVELYDGTRLVSAARSGDGGGGGNNDAAVVPIHPAFRVVALGQTAAAAGAAGGGGGGAAAGRGGGVAVGGGMPVRACAGGGGTNETDERLIMKSAAGCLTHDPTHPSLPYTTPQ
jgi:hypothetical protein